MAHKRKMKVPPVRPEKYVLDKAKAYEIVWPRVSPLFDIARDIQNRSFVYAIGEEGDGPVKIGLAKDPIARLRSMQTGNPRRLKVEQVILGRIDIEKLLHEIWEEFAIKAVSKRNKVDVAPGTEWFDPTIRAKLFPIMETSAAEQIEYLLSTEDNVVNLGRLEQIVREAHVFHGVEMSPREQPRLLAPGGGYILVGRRTRI